MHGLRPGATVGVRGPFGTGWDLSAAAGRDLLVVAGGLGLAPLRPLVDDVLAVPRRYGRLNVLIGARTPGDLLCAQDIDGWRAAGARVQIAVDRPDDRWHGDVGVVTALLDRAAFDPDNAAAFLCGPEVMIRATARDLTHRRLARNGSGSPWSAPCTAAPDTAATASSARCCCVATARSFPGPKPNHCFP